MRFSPGVVPQWPSRRGLTCDALERLAEERVVVEVDLPDGEVVRRPPVGVHLAKLLGRKRTDLRAHCASFDWSRITTDGGVGLPASGLIVGHGYVTMQGFAFQIPAAYSAIVRSLENLPDAATLRIAFRAQPSRSA